MPSIEKIEELLEREPNDVFLNFGLAMALRSAGREDESLARFDRTCEIEPTYVAAYFQKAVLLEQIGRSDEARGALESGIDQARKIGDQHAEGEMREYLETLGS